MIKSFLALTNRQDFDASRRFSNSYQIRDALRKKYPSEEFKAESQILIFDTERQHTWLVASDKRLYCVIDNRRDRRPKLIWSLDKSSIGAKTEIIAEDFDENYGIIMFPGQRPRKYSRSLYDERGIISEIGRIINL